MSDRGKGGAPLWEGEMRYRHPWDFLDLAPPPNSNFWSVAPPPKDSKIFFRVAKIVQILMKIVQIHVVFGILGYISLFFDPYSTISAKF